MSGNSLMSIIRNKDELLSHGCVEERRSVLDIIEYALSAMDSYRLVRELVCVEGNVLRVASLSYELSEIGDIYVVGAGKGSSSIAEALEHILGDKIKTGLIIEKRGQGRRLKRIDVMEAGHPVPDDDSVRGSEKLIQITNGAKKNDLFLVCVTGGCSALMTLPCRGISLEDVKEVTELLLMCGANIQEINAVRKHISQLTGGRLATHVHPAEMVSLIVVDEVLGLPWGPTVPDTTTYQDAISVLKRYGLWKKVPDSVRKHLETADPKQETPKAKDFETQGVKVHNIVLASGETVCEAARKRAEKLGYHSMILSTVIEGESREAGIVLAGVAKEVERSGRPLKPPCCLIVGGETTVTIAEEPGDGGRNQEFALSASLKIDGSKRIVVASIGTDGTDGPTDIAGGIVDGYTLQRAIEKEIDVFANLMRHNSSYVFRQLDDAIYTGSTGTNVMDLRLIIVGAQ